MEYTVYLSDSPAHYIMMQYEDAAKLIVENNDKFEMAYDSVYFKNYLAEDAVANLDGDSLLIHRDRLRGYVHQRRALVDRPDDDWLLDRALEVEIFLAKRAKECRRRMRFEELRQYLINWDGKSVKAVQAALFEYLPLAGRLGRSGDEAIIFDHLRENRNGWKGPFPDPDDFYTLAVDAAGQCLGFDHEREFFVVPVEKLRASG
jgi:hypothetical protein